MYVEDLKRGPNAEIGPKDYFEIGSKLSLNQGPQKSRFGGFSCPYMNINVKSVTIVLRCLFSGVMMKRQPALNVLTAG